MEVMEDSARKIEVKDVSNTVQAEECKGGKEEEENKSGRGGK